MLLVVSCSCHCGDLHRKDNSPISFLMDLFSSSGGNGGGVVVACGLVPGHTDIVNCANHSIIMLSKASASTWRSELIVIPIACASSKEIELPRRPERC